MRTNDKIKEIEQKQKFQSDWFEEALQEMADWKVEQFAQEKQQWIDKAWNWFTEQKGERTIDDFKKAMKGE